ncbi:MAG: bifunctional riboflavin kinase/FAD synthetase [Prolixibacteraceae bacterium]|nr:bifunctional riboflavin kinase/FAD synthetase [Prolixibacteraceae bacterium]
MKIHNDIDRFKASKPVITIGTFDGVHLGHRKVIGQLNDIARRTGGESVVFTFYPHPRLVVSPHEANLRLLTTLDEKQKLLEAAGVDHMIVYPFTREFASLTYRQFIADILLERMNMDTLVFGHDHRLGKGRQGTYENIVELASEMGFSVEKIDTFIVDESHVSSSKIREALLNGEIEVANIHLGYSYSIPGNVTLGNQIGRSIGFPTANIETLDPHKLIPAEGVYAVTVMLDGKIYKGMLNIGYRPTLYKNADHRTVEVHIFDFCDDIYKKDIVVSLHTRIRDEKKFDSINHLKVQLTADREYAMKALANIKL